MNEAMRSDRGQEARAPRWMKAALIVSLGLNLLVAGVLASAAWHLRSGGSGPGGRLSGFIQTLPPERSEALSQIVEKSREAIRAERQELREQRGEVRRLFAADPVDKEAFAAANARMIETHMHIRQSYVQLMTELAEKMTAEERRAFIEWRESHRRGSRGADRGND